MKLAVIIPTRMAATRFPGKPLVNIAGLTMIEHVYRRCAIAVGKESVWIATCDSVLQETAANFGANVIMTSDQHVRCTDRIAEAARKIECDVVINVQGDEPVLDPNAIHKVLEPFKSDTNCIASNLIQKIDPNFEDPNSYNMVKVVFDLKKRALYFSRAPIPAVARGERNGEYFKQIGLIAFKKSFLEQFSKLAPTPLEFKESVDMMRMIEHGFPLHLVESDSRFLSVDVPGDLIEVEKALKTDAYFKKYSKKT